MIKVIENYGMASADAMVLNIFNCSKIEILITADNEMAETANQFLSGKKAIYLVK